jgi:peptidoglycan/LPS O-acetylase OafA/YrhL
LLCTRYKWLNIIIFLVANAIIFKIDGTYLSFSLGIALAYLQQNYKSFEIQGWAALLLVIFGLILGSKDNYIGLLDALYMQVTGAILKVNARYCFVIGGFFIVFAVLFNARLAQLLNTAWGRFLGEISFPLYLVHIPVLFSLGGYVYILTQSQFLTSLSVVFVSLLLSIPLAYGDKIWVKWLSQQVNRLFKPHKRG